MDSRKAPVFKKLENKKEAGKYRVVSLASIPGKVMEQLILDLQASEKRVTGISQHGFTKGKIMLKQPGSLL